MNCKSVNNIPDDSFCTQGALIFWQGCSNKWNKRCEELNMMEDFIQTYLSLDLYIWSS